MLDHRTEDRIHPDDIVEALTGAPFVYADGATQVFTTDGETTYIEHGSQTHGQWGVDEHGRFWSFWPPDYRAEYDVFWLADTTGISGVRFVDRTSGATSAGRYTPQPRPTVE